MAEGGENSRDERRNRGGERAASSLNSDDVCQIVEALMAGGLAHSINKTVKRQAELAVGDLYVRANTRAEESVEKRDFAVMLEELVARRKEAAESITAYYHSKLELCDRVDVRGTRAVSVIIRGLPEDLRANAYAAQCATPGELYGSFLAGVESHGEEGHRRSVWSRITLPSVASGSRRDEPQAIRRCYNCQKYTAHLSKNCPAPVAERCAICGDRSHMKADCPRRRTQQQASYKRSAVRGRLYR